MRFRIFAIGAEASGCLSETLKPAQPVAHWVQLAMLWSTNFPFKSDQQLHSPDAVDPTPPIDPVRESIGCALAMEGRPRLSSHCGTGSDVAMIAILRGMRSTNIADLRNRLTLKQVRAGEEIVVRHRRRPILKIVSFTVNEDEEEEAAADLVAAGVIRKGTGKLPRSFLSTRRRPGFSWEVAVAAVRADRDED